MTHALQGPCALAYMPSLISVMLPVKDANTVGSGDNRCWLQHWQDVKSFPTRHLDSAQLSLQQVTIPLFCRQAGSASAGTGVFSVARNHHSQLQENQHGRIDLHRTLTGLSQPVSLSTLQRCYDIAGGGMFHITRSWHSEWEGNRRWLEELQETEVPPIDTLLDKCLVKPIQEQVGVNSALLPSQSTPYQLGRYL